MAQLPPVAVVVAAALLACNSPATRPAEDPPSAPPPPPRTAAPIATQEYTPPPVAAQATPGDAAAGTDPGASADAPEISRSAGVAGGAVVLWPRIVLPRDAGAPDLDTLKLAARAQSRLAEVARRVLGNAAIDVRPEPERVCPRNGCNGIALGILFAKAGAGCSLFALVGAPGTSPQRIVPWSPGAVRLSADTVGFREPPEKVVKVTDYGTCAKLPDDLAGKDADVEAAIRSVAGR